MYMSTWVPLQELAAFPVLYIADIAIASALQASSQSLNRTIPTLGEFPVEHFPVATTA